MAPAPPAVISDPVAFHAKSMKIEGLEFPVVTDLASFAGKTLMLVKPTMPLTPEEIEAIVSKGQGGMGLLVVGDGPVEIRNAKSNGGIAVGVASDEVAGQGWNMDKRPRLVKAGCDILVPDFGEMDAILRYLFEE